MPPTYSIFSNSTTIIYMVDGNFNLVRGTTITNTDSFNFLESTVSGQSEIPTTPLSKQFVSFGYEAFLQSDLKRSASNFPVSPNTSAEGPDHDTERPSSNTGNIYFRQGSFNVPSKPSLMDWYLLTRSALST